MIAKTNKIELLSKEMNLNHEIIIFNDIDYRNSILCMRMMLKSENKIKKYKFVELKLNELSIKNKEKKILSFPFKSKLTFNYTLTNDKNIVSNFIKDAKDKRDEKKPKSIFEQTDEEDDNCQEESENSDEIKNEINNSGNNSNNGSNSNIIKIDNNKEENNNIIDFRQRLSIFEKGGPPKKIEIQNAKNNKIRTNNIAKAEKLKGLKIDNKPDNININKKENNNINNKKINNDKNNKNEIIKNEKNNKNPEVFKSNEIIKNMESKIPKKSIINKNEKSNEINNKKQEKNKNEENKIIENNNNISEIVKKLNAKNNSEIYKKYENSKTAIFTHNNNVNKSKINKENPISKDDLDIKKSKTKNKTEININKSEFILKSKNIDISEEYNPKTFCNCFFICSFPYKNGKIMENSKDCRSVCSHPICCKLLAMEPEIIYKYPFDDIGLELNNLSASICFPLGVKICYNQERRSIYKSFSTHILNQKGEKYYMTIYHFYRQLDSMTYNKLFSDNPLKIYLRQFGDNIYSNKAQKEKLEKDLEECQELGFREYVFIPYAFVLVSKYPYINQMRSCLNIIYKILTNHEDILKNIEENIKTSLINKILAYLIHGIPIPNANCEISFNMPFCSNKIKIASPYKNNIRNLENVNFAYILSKFCPENIIKIFQLMLFENKLLFIDKDYNRLSTVIDSFINILYPIDWENTVIPIMSDQMTRYLQTYLPFINGISEDLLEKSAEKALKEAEEGIFKIYIVKDLIKYSKPNNEDDAFASLPKLPKEIYKKLYSELSDLIEAYKSLSDKDKEKYALNINHTFRNIFLETICIMLYCLMDYALNNEKGYNGFSSKTLKIMYGKDSNFYKDLTETQIFQTFMTNFIQRKKNYSLFISMLKNITEKYIKSVDKQKFQWKNTIRKFKKEDIKIIPILFKIPNHLSNRDNNSVITYYIEKPEWTEINQKLESINNNNVNNLLSNDIIQENERIAFVMNPIKKELNIPINNMERFIFPEENQDYLLKNNNLNLNPRCSFHISVDFEKVLKLNYVKADQYLKDESDLTKEEQENIKKNINQVITSLLKNNPIQIDVCLNNVYYNFGRDLLCKLMYQKGFKVVKKLSKDCFDSLNKICINAFVAISNLDENENDLEFAAKITSSAFCYCKEDNEKIFLIDELRNNLGSDYFIWNKKSFWNAWQHLENYFTISDYGIFCQVIVHDFVNKLLKLKLEKDFITNYLVSALAEKMILLEHSSELSKDTIKENQNLFVENRTKIMEYINNSEY